MRALSTDGQNQSPKVAQHHNGKDKNLKSRQPQLTPWNQWLKIKWDNCPLRRENNGLRLNVKKEE